MSPHHDQGNSCNFKHPSGNCEKRVTQLTQVVNAKEDAIERLYDEVKAERDQRNSVECEADRVVAILRGQIDVLEQQLAIQNKQQAEDSEGKKAGSGQLEGATPLGQI